MKLNRLKQHQHILLSTDTTLSQSEQHVGWRFHFIHRTSVTYGTPVLFHPGQYATIWVNSIPNKVRREMW